MAKKPVCLVCQKEMELGFMTDRGHGATVHLPRWCAGEPKPGIFSEATRSQAGEGFTVVAYRCPECEALRLYAPSGR